MKQQLFKGALLLSYIGSGSGVLLFLTAFVFYQKTNKIVTDLTNITAFQSISKSYLFIFGLLYVISFTGVVKMSKFLKTGYYLYIIAQLSLLFIPVFYIGINTFSVTNTIFTVLFITIYSATFLSGKLRIESRE